jgi:protein-S-isoprenylcysteine O-methyltransferase Ste14
VEDPTISALAGSVVAAGLIVGMLFEGWLDSLLSAGRARLADLAAVAAVAALLYVALRAYADAVGWTRAEPAEWIAYAGLNAIGAGVILHVAVGRRWPFASSKDTTGDDP